MKKKRIEQIKNKALYQDAEYEDVMELIEQIERYEEAMKKAIHECLLENPYKAHEILDDALEDKE